MLNSATSISAISFLVLFMMGFGQILYAQESAVELRLVDRGLHIQNRLEIDLSRVCYEDVTEKKGKRTFCKPNSASFNGESIIINELHTRGKTTLHMRRKSFSIQVDSKIPIQYGARTVSMKKFYTISLSMDRNYIRNRIAYELMDTLGLFRLFHSFGELVLNGSTEGIYMMLERPQDWALKTKDSPLILRRGFNHKVEKIKTGKKIDKSEIKSYKSIFSNIYKNLNKIQGAELYSKLTQWIDLEMYMQWLAFNYFVHNGDYTDEVYFYIDPNDNRYKIIPWDYDDIFAREPHEGMKQKKSNIKDKLLFSSEDRLDQKIASDPFLYNKYLEQLQSVLDALNPQIVAGVFQNTFAELYPFYVRGDIIAISRNDTFKEASLETLQDDLKRTYQQLMIFRTSNLNIIAESLEKN